MNQKILACVGKSKGFTLIELLVVIAIIGILAAVVILNFRGYTNRARDSKIKDYLGQVKTAIEVYKTDHSDNLPSVVPDNLETDNLLPSNSKDNAMGSHTFSYLTGATGFIVCGQMYTSSNYLWVDSTGASGSSGSCPASP